MLEIPKKQGRPTEYQPEFCENILPLAPLGCTVEQMATLLRVTDRTIYNWLETHDDFFQAVQLARLQAHMEVGHSVFKQATRYGNVAAAIFWLKSHYPKIWREKQELDLRMPDGVQISLVDRAKLDGKSDEECLEIERKLKEALELAQQLQIKSEK
jgi:hypothetical protein